MTAALDVGALAAQLAPSMLLLGQALDDLYAALRTTGLPHEACVAFVRSGVEVYAPELGRGER